MNILLINPPGEEKSFTDVKVNLNLSKKPLGILTIAAYLKMNGYSNTKVVDLANHLLSKKEFTNILYSFDPDIIGITVYTILYKNVIELVNYIRKIKPGTKFVFGGPHATYKSKELLYDTGGDYVVRGEGESAMIELLSNIKYGFPKLQSIKGLVWRNKKGEVKENKNRKRLLDIEVLPFPDTTQLENSHYLPFSLITSRGCPGNCIFCSNVSMFGTKFRCISADSVYGYFYHYIGEMKRSSSNKDNNQTIYIEDSCFTASESRAKKVCELLIQNKSNIGWECLTRFDKINKELIDYLDHANCKLVLIGVETISPNVQFANNKSVLKEELEDILEYSMYKKNLNIGLSFIIGLPGETTKTINQLWDYIKYIWRKYKLIRVDLNCNALFPGTYQEKNFEVLGLKTESKARSRTSRITPNIYTKDFSINDLQKVMTEYLKELNNNLILKK